MYAQTKHSMRYYHHWGTTGFMIWIHGMCLLAPATYNPKLAAACLPIYYLFGLGIEMVYHRMLTHKAFASPKWWEYTMAYIGVLNIQVCIASSSSPLPRQCCCRSTQMLLNLRCVLEITLPVQHCDSVSGCSTATVCTVMEHKIILCRCNEVLHVPMTSSAFV